MERGADPIECKFSDITIRNHFSPQLVLSLFHKNWENPSQIEVLRQNYLEPLFSSIGTFTIVTFTFPQKLRKSLLNLNSQTESYGTTFLLFHNRNFHFSTNNEKIPLEFKFSDKTRWNHFSPQLEFSLFKEKNKENPSVTIVTFPFPQKLRKSLSNF